MCGKMDESVSSRIGIEDSFSREIVHNIKISQIIGTEHQLPTIKYRTRTNIRRGGLKVAKVMDRIAYRIIMEHPQLYKIMLKFQLRDLYWSIVNLVKKDISI